MSIVRIQTPLTDELVEKLESGQQVLISGKIYTARDAAHQRLIKLLEEGKSLPIDLAGQIIYYVGPAPARPGKVIGSAGPTTSGRMDAFAPRLLELGLKGMIGKGSRSQLVKDAIKQQKAVYMAAVGGAAALLAKTVVSCKVIAYPELGPEAIHELIVEDFPAIVINDAHGNDLYLQGIEQYAREN